MRCFMMSAPSRTLCPMCNFETPSLELCLSHLRLVHSNDPRFCAQCGIGGCSYTGRSFSALYSHIYRSHPESGVIRRRGYRRTKRDDIEPGTSRHSEEIVQELHFPDLQGIRPVLNLCTSVTSTCTFFRRRKS